MNVVIIARATFFTVPGGDTVQAVQTAKHLQVIGVSVDIKLTNETIDYSKYDLLHFFNVIRPADILFHSRQSNKPYVISTILCDYSEFDQHHRAGTGWLLSLLSANGIEYVKTVGRWLLGRDHLASKDYLWRGHKRSVNAILKSAAMILPNSRSEYERVGRMYLPGLNHQIIPNGVSPELFRYDPGAKKDEKLVLCVARIEGLKNQINLIRALNNTDFKLLIIGAPAPNQKGYYQRCKDIAAANVTFIDHIPQDELVAYYQRAKVHVLPSWFETTGLSSLEAALMGCNIVITNKGDTREYFDDNAFYCEPEKPESILAAIQKASVSGANQNLREKILKKFTWHEASLRTKSAYLLSVAP